MSAVLDYTVPACPQESPTWSRRGVAEKMALFETLDSPWTSCRQIAGQLEVPPRTLHYWVRREWALIENSSWPQPVARFLETPAGLDFLHRLFTAAHLVFGQASDCGLRNLGWFFKLSGLDTFIASSYGAQQAVAEELESLLVRFGEEEDHRLAASMPPREITLCEDETFHPQICLVAIEPVSNFILVEQYQPQRDAQTWQQCTGAKLAALPVTVCQVTSDAAKALIAQAETCLGAHHSPDLFHVQYDTVKATSGALASQTHAACRELEKRQERTTEFRAKCQADAEAGRPNSLVDVLAGRAQEAEVVARERVHVCQARQERAQAARQGLGRDYHPIDLVTGQALTAEEVGRRLQGHFDTLDQVAAEAGLSAHARDKLAKARRVLSAMRATLAFFWTMVAARLAAWGYDATVQQWLRQELIPAYYLRRVAEKAGTAQERQRLRALATEVLARARSPDGPWGTFSLEFQAELESRARQCADLFQRSSSCVEGRNGQLSLRHHALHHLTARKLQALTVLHNYAVTRADGSTAASRFYGATPRDLFGWLLRRLSLPARPRAARQSA
jgi:Family of unknown function (DUF6399)